MGTCMIYIVTSILPLFIYLHHTLVLAKQSKARSVVKLTTEQ